MEAVMPKPILLIDEIHLRHVAGSISGSLDAANHLVDVSNSRMVLL